MDRNTRVIFEAHWPHGFQVMSSWRSFGADYDNSRIAELTAQGFIVDRIELKN